MNQKAKNLGECSAEIVFVKILYLYREAKKLNKLFFFCLCVNSPERTALL